MSHDIGLSYLLFRSAQPLLYVGPITPFMGTFNTARNNQVSMTPRNNTALDDCNDTVLVPQSNKGLAGFSN